MKISLAMDDGFMILDKVTVSSFNYSSAFNVSCDGNVNLKWHARLCHVVQDRMNRLGINGFSRLSARQMVQSRDTKLAT